MKLRFTPRAARDIAEIADYIREHSPQAALRVPAHKQVFTRYPT
jgi:plasmid stabilization system protein ParE